MTQHCSKGESLKDARYFLQEELTRPDILNFPNFVS